MIYLLLQENYQISTLSLPCYKKTTKILIWFYHPKSVLYIHHPSKGYNYPYKMGKQMQTQIIVVVILRG